jgi:hypothetical protein
MSGHYPMTINFPTIDFIIPMISINLMIIMSYHYSLSMCRYVGLRLELELRDPNPNPYN